METPDTPQNPLPEDFTTLDPEALEALRVDLVARFDEASAADTITADDLAALRQLRDAITAVRGEQDGRVAAAQEAQAEIDALRGEIHAEDEGGEGGDQPGEGDAPAEDAPAEDAPADAPDGGDGGDGGEGGDAPADAAGELVTAAAAPSPRPLDMREVRRRQPAPVLPAETATGPALPIITASADVPGVSTGQVLDVDSLVRGVTERAIQLMHTKRPGASAIVASYAAQFPEELQVNDPGSAPAGTSAVLAAANQARLPGGDLTASGGWCAPSETVYTIADIACPDMLWSAPEIQLSRGGLRYFLTPTLDVSALTWIHTEANDIAGAEKPCFKVPCPEPVEVRCDAVGVCIEAGILTERFFPELVSWYVRNSMVAHEIRISQAMFTEALASATHVEGAASFAAFTAVFGQVALQSADLIEKHSLCETTAIEVVFPWWSRNLFLADIARQNGMSPADIDPAIITRAFSTLGVSVQFARGLTPGVPTAIGGATPAEAWPEEIDFLMYPTGTFQIGRGAEVNLGAVYDSEKFKTNDFTALWTEECVALLNRGPEARHVTVPVCPDGTTGAINIGTEVECPIDAGSVVS
jgi:hypothetical protein